LYLHHIVDHSSRPNPEAKPSVIDENSIATLLIFEVKPGDELDKVICTEGYANEKWDALSVQDPGVRYQRTKNAGEHNENRSDLVPKNDCCRVNAILDIFISILLVGSAGENRTQKDWST
jgi:hypothetical protein